MKKTFNSGKIWTLLSALLFFMTCGVFIVYAIPNLELLDTGFYSKRKTTNEMGETLTADYWNELMDELSSRSIPDGAIMAFNTSSCPFGWTEFSEAKNRFLRGVSESSSDLLGVGQIGYDGNNVTANFKYVNVLYCVKGTPSNHTVSISAELGGDVDKTSVNAEHYSSITTSGNILKIGRHTVTATPRAGFKFISWINSGCNASLTSDCSYRAAFNEVSSCFISPGVEVSINSRTECGGANSVDATCGKNFCKNLCDSPSCTWNQTSGNDGYFNYNGYCHCNG